MQKKSKISFKDMAKTAPRLGRTELKASDLKMVTGGSEANSSTLCNDLDYPH